MIHKADISSKNIRIEQSINICIIKTIWNQLQDFFKADFKNSSFRSSCDSKVDKFSLLIILIPLLSVLLNELPLPMSVPPDVGTLQLQVRYSIKTFSTYSEHVTIGVGELS